MRIRAECGFRIVSEEGRDFLEKAADARDYELEYRNTESCPAGSAGRLRRRGVRSTDGRRTPMDYAVKQIAIDDYDAILALWNSSEQSRRALNPVDDSREGIDRYLKRNPNTCFAAVRGDEIIGVILAGHDGRRGIIHHMCVHPDCRRMGIAGRLVSAAEEALKKEGIWKIFGMVFKDNAGGNAFWERQGYSLRRNLNYRNKSLHADIPTGE